MLCFYADVLSRSSYVFLFIRFKTFQHHALWCHSSTRKTSPTIALCFVCDFICVYHYFFRCFFAFRNPFVFDGFVFVRFFPMLNTISVFGVFGVTISHSYLFPPLSHTLFTVYLTKWRILWTLVIPVCENKNNQSSKTSTAR